MAAAQGAGAAPLKRAALPDPFAGGSSLMRKDPSPPFRNSCLLVVPHLPVVVPSALTEGCTMSGALHGPCLHNFNLKTMINVYRDLPINL